jgi:alkylhydroperoxidase family enzyme
MKWQNEFYASLFGSTSTRVSIRSGNQIVTYPTTGCVAYASRSLYGNMQGLIALQSELQQALVTTTEVTEASSSWLRAEGSWRRCMASRGLQFASPQLAASKSTSAGPMASRHEIAVATAEVTCADDVGLEATWRRVENKEDLLASKRLSASVTRFQQMETGEIEAAERLLGAHK